MAAQVRLDDHSVLQGEGLAPDVRRTILSMAQAARRLSELLAAAPLITGLTEQRAEAHGDVTKELDLRSDALMMQALREAPVRFVASEESDAPVAVHADCTLAVAIDPLDGSSNIETNAPMGTIFSILPAMDDPLASFLRPGRDQVAAGFFIYGSHTALVLTTGDGTHIFVLDRDQEVFLEVGAPVHIPLAAREYAINGSNERHWDAPVRRFVEECRQGAEGPLGRDFNTRWLASLVAEAYRILGRGGVYMYPRDARPGYAQGRLRLVYEAAPIAWLIEEAGGAATDGHRRILDLVPQAIHQRVPLAFGAVEDVTRLASYFSAPEPTRHEPLFATRTLFRGSGGMGSLACR